MRKFSSLNETTVTSNNVTIRRTGKTIEETLMSIINDCVGIETNENNTLDQNSTIEGKDVLIEKVKEIISSIELQHTSDVNEQIAYINRNFYDEKQLLEKLNKMENYICEFNEEFRPENIFSPVDYEKNGDTVVLNSLTEIPDVFSDYIKFDSIIKYFRNDNVVKITYIEGIGIWKLDFTGDENVFGISVTKDEERHLLFINANIKFIDSFYDACSMFLSKSKVVIVDPVLRERLKQ